MSLPAQRNPYAFWPAWLLTGRSRLVPPLATIWRLHLMLDAHASEFTSPARMDFRSFLVDNCIEIRSSPVTPAQATAVMDLIEER
ncbi:unnamed protein product [Cochlearia groenlandica]